jgi:hypothetical protein
VALPGEFAGAGEACTVGNAEAFVTVFGEFPEQPATVDRTPVDTNKRTFFILTTSQKSSRLNCLSLRLCSRSLNSPKVQVCL